MTLLQINPHGQTRSMTRVTVIPWEPGQYGVELKWSDGYYECYAVGNQQAAKAEAKRRGAVALARPKTLVLQCHSAGRGSVRKPSPKSGLQVDHQYLPASN